MKSYIDDLLYSAGQGTSKIYQVSLETNLSTTYVAVYNSSTAAAPTNR